MLIIILSFLCASSLANIEKPFYSLEDAEQHFEDFILKYDKQYADEVEKEMRFEYFKLFLQEINERNSDPEETATFGITQFADLSGTEFSEKYTGFQPVPVDDVTHISGPVTMDLPESFDWSENNAVTRVKNQKNCRSCWAFSVTGTVEGAYAIKHKKVEEFSEQQLIDCSQVGSCQNGGDIVNALKYLQKIGGSETETSYPYIEKDGDCAFDKNQIEAKVTGYVANNVSTNEDQLRQILYENGPLSIALDSKSLSGATHGIIKNCTFNNLDHAVLLVGYGTENGTPFWKIKNSWGTEMGEDGYYRIKRGVNACGMLTYPASYAIVD